MNTVCPACCVLHQPSPQHSTDFCVVMYLNTQSPGAVFICERQTLENVRTLSRLNVCTGLQGFHTWTENQCLSSLLVEEMCLNQFYWILNTRWPCPRCGEQRPCHVWPSPAPQRIHSMGVLMEFLSYLLQASLRCHPYLQQPAGENMSHVGELLLWATCVTGHISYEKMGVQHNPVDLVWPVTQMTLSVSPAGMNSVRGFDFTYSELIDTKTLHSG